jgi:UDP-N-acetylmuramoyl-tripeptide--D-alanyl-D-alanine ligase
LLSETKLLCDIANPDFGLITNIGKDHLEGFGSVEGVAKANGELFEHLVTNKGLAFVNTNQPLIVELAKRLTRRVTYPGNGDFLFAEGTLDGAYLHVTANGYSATTHLTGLYNLENVAAALCVGRYFDVDLPDALEEVSLYKPTNQRSQWLETETNKVLVDCYNANPTSMRAALESLQAMHTNGNAKVAILADMAELGASSQPEHQALGSYLQDSGIASILLAGPEMRAAADACPRAHYFETVSSLSDYLREQKPGGGTILLKGSRASKLEQLVELL